MKHLILRNWLTKILTLFVAVAIWYLVKSNESRKSFVIPVPGETTIPDKGSIPLLPSNPDATGDILTSPVPGADTSTPATPPPPEL